MHDGSLPTLEAVVAHYDRGGEDRPSKSRSIVPLGLSAGDQADLVAFLRTLTSPVASNVIPALPR
jgi:cytochrome c peroxidase